MASLGLVTQLVIACSGRAIESGAESAGASGSGETAGSGNTSGSGAASGEGGNAGTLALAGAGGSRPDAGAAGALPLAGAGGASLREPVKHRATATECDHTRATNDPNVPSEGGAPVSCRAHSDCTEGENGRCAGNGHDGWRCTYDSCFTDLDCAGGVGGPGVCACEGGSRSDNNVCLVGNCRVDADCGEGGYCSPSLGDCGNYFGVVGYFCHTDADVCVDDADCGAGGGSSQAYCAFKPTVGHWMCSNLHCAG